MAKVRTLEEIFTNPAVEAAVKKNFAGYLISSVRTSRKDYDEYKEDQQELLKKTFPKNPSVTQITEAIRLLNVAIDKLQAMLAGNKHSIDQLGDKLMSIADNELDAVKTYLPTALHYETQFKLSTIGNYLVRYRPPVIEDKEVSDLLDVTMKSIKQRMDIVDRDIASFNDQLGVPPSNLIAAFIESKLRLKGIQQQMIKLEDQQKAAASGQQVPSVTRNSDSSNSGKSDAQKDSPSSNRQARVSPHTFINNKKTEEKEPQTACKCTIM